MELFEPLVSVIIPCYNHEKYLSEAIQSVIEQSYPSYEIVVIDDGSTDKSRLVVEKYAGVNCVFQNNAGLSAARNKGISLSRGKYLVFLDADDWLCPEALQINTQFLEKNPEAAFVSGSHQKVNQDNEIIESDSFSIDTNHYLNLLQGNYIGMHATVMYQRWVFDFCSYDTSLKACEDYDLYLKIARKFPVLHHQECIAVYRIHDTNMSGNIPLMLGTVISVLKRQESVLLNNEEVGYFKNGLEVWKNYYIDKLYNKLLIQSFTGMLNSRKELKTLLIYNKTLYFKTFAIHSMKTIKRIFNSFFKSHGLSPGKVNLGDLNRTIPFSTQFGYDRGGPVDRYYIENFLEQNKELIRGRVLEIGDNEYTLRFGGGRIKQSDILHVDAKNAKATYIGDLCDIPILPDNSFDCIVLTQTLHLIYYHQKALETCYRVLKPGGVLLLTVPGISHIDQGEWKDIWLWAFTQSSITKMLSEVFPVSGIKTQTHGNVLVATAFLYGMGLPELKKGQMDEMDPHYQVIITATAFKPDTTNA